MGNFERIRAPRMDREFKRRKIGIKAVVSQSVLAAVIKAAEKHCASCKRNLDEQGNEPHTQCKNCKLKTSIEYALVALKKCNKKNKTASEYRREMMDRVAEKKLESERAEYGGVELHGLDAAADYAREGFAKAMSDALDKARPTIW